MKVSWAKYRLRFKTAFTLSKGTRDGTDGVILKLQEGETVAFGMAAIPPYFNKADDDVIDCFKQLSFSTQQLLDQQLDHAAEVCRGNSFALAATDIALHNFYSLSSGAHLRDIYNYDSGKVVKSSYTIGVSHPDEVNDVLTSANEFDFLKLKMGMEGEWDILRRLTELSDKPYFIDVNQGWSDRESAIRNIEKLINHPPLFVEDPIPGLSPEDHAWLKMRSEIPIYIDEGMKSANDLQEFIGAVDGINIKLMKSGGLREAAQMIALAKNNNVQLMLGCMSESSNSIAAACSIANAFEYCDLDGPALIKNDPFVGLTYDKGSVSVKSDLYSIARLREDVEIEWESN